VHYAESDVYVYKGRFKSLLTFPGACRLWHKQVSCLRLWCHRWQLPCAISTGESWRHHPHLRPLSDSPW